MTNKKTSTKATPAKKAAAKKSPKSTDLPAMKQALPSQTNSPKPTTLRKRFFKQVKSWF